MYLFQKSETFSRTSTGPSQRTAEERTVISSTHFPVPENFL